MSGDRDRQAQAAQAAWRAFVSWPHERVLALLHDLATDHARRAWDLAEATVAETGMGAVADKAVKNLVASVGVWEVLRDAPGVGVLVEDDGIVSIARPVGVVFAITPVTNPGPSLIHNILSALMGRNAIVLSPHHATTGVAGDVAAHVAAVLARHGAPEHLVQILTTRSGRDETLAWMAHPAVDLVLATGGAGLVRAAYRSGKPAVGVGPGNAPCWIAADADPVVSVAAIVDSAAFDHGLTCGSESHLVVDAAVARDTRALLAEHGAHVLGLQETQRLRRRAFGDHGRLHAGLVGRSATEIARAVGLEAGAPRLLVCPVDGVQDDDPLCHESLAPIVTLLRVDGDADALDTCRALLDVDGAGHSAAVHTADDRRVARFAAAMPVSRVFVNGPCAHGTVGVTSMLDPTFTVGSGTWGGCTTTGNVGWRDLVNVQRVVHARPTDLTPAGRALAASSR